MISTMPKLIRYSKNTALVDKREPADKQAYAHGWQNVETSLDDLIASIKAGYAFAPQYRDGYRKGENFVCTAVLAADFDGSRTLLDVRNDAFCNSHASFIYTTASHSEEEHRFRVVFLLDRLIESAADYADAQLGLAEKLGSDLSVSDGARCLFGSTTGQIFRYAANRLAADDLAQLVDRGQMRRKASATRAPLGVSRALNRSSTVKLRDGSLANLADLAPLTAIYCPYHEDRHPSAFTVKSTKTGSRGIHCKACNVTYFENDPDEYDFDGFERLVEQRHANPLKKVDSSSPFDEFFPAKPTCIVTQDRFLTPFLYQPGVTLVKSPKGTGKTEILKKVVSDILSGRNLDHIDRKDRPKTILIIGHRRSLLREAAAKLGLLYYLDINEVLFRNPNTLAVCLDSLPKFTELYIYNSHGPAKFRQDAPFDLVILDEAEQVLTHSIGGTLAKTPGAIDRAYDALEYQVSRAKSVIALDADLSLLTAHALRAFRARDWDHDTRIIYNRPVTPKARRTLQLYEREADLRDDLLDAIARGDRCFVACNSKRTVNVLAQIIGKRLGARVKMQVITSDNSGGVEEVDFVGNIVDRFLTIQVLICSPSLGTGIDITFPDPLGEADGGLCMVDCVYGFFSANVNTHTDMDQQLCRVRNPKAVKVWISPAPFQYSTNFDVIRDDLARARFVPRAVEGYSEDGQTTYRAEHPQLMIYSHVVASQRSSKNRLIGAFCELRKKHGWDIEQIGSSGKKDIDRRDAEKALWGERVNGLLKAPVLDDDAYFDLVVERELPGNLDKQSEYAYARNTIERQLGVPLTYDIICLNYDDRLCDRVAVLRSIQLQWEHFQADAKRDLVEANQPLGRLPKMPEERLLCVIARVAGLCGTGGFDENASVTADELGAFSELCERNRTLMEELLGAELRKDIRTNPIRQLNIFLKFCGLRLEKRHRKRAGGRAKRIYGLNREILTEMARFAANFQQPRDLKDSYKRLQEAAAEWKPEVYH